MSLRCQPRLGANLHAPGALEFRTQFIVLDVLKAGQAVGDGAHVSAALHIVLSAQRIQSTAVAAHVTGEQREIDEGDNVVHRVVMLGDAERPADLRALGLGVGVRGLADDFGGHAGLALRVLERVLLDASRYASNPLVAFSMNHSFASPEAIISRAMALASAISEPTSRPSHTSAHCAEHVRRGSTT